MDDLLYFYSAAAQISFVMLGFWWAIVTFKHDEWMADPRHERMSRYVSLHFLLPGTMSLVSILATDNGVLWRSGFGAGGALGAVAAALCYQSSRGRPAATEGSHDASWLLLVAVYLAVATVAAGGPRLTEAVGLGARALVVEGALVSLLLLLGAHLAWALFSQPRRPTA